MPAHYRRQANRPCRSRTPVGVLTIGSTQIDIPAGALFHGMTVDGLCDLDLSYTPPFGSPLDAIELAAQAWIDQVDGSQSAGRTR